MRTRAVETRRGCGEPQGLRATHFRGAEDVEDAGVHLVDGSGRGLRPRLDHLFEAGFIMINTCSATISTAMGEAEIDGLVSAMESGFRKLSVHA